MNKKLHIKSNWLNKVVKKNSNQSEDKAKNKNDASTYFSEAGSWSDDYYATAIASRNRYRIGFYSMSALVSVLALTIASLVPLQHTELEVVHEGNSGYTWISTTSAQKNISENWQRTKAEIAHYVRTRESYDPVLYGHQFDEVNLLSSSEVKNQYELSQSSSNKSAPINILGAKGYRTVTINNVLSLDSESRNVPNGAHNHINLAQVDYVVEDHFFGGAKTIKTPYTALVSWTYNGTPSDPKTMLSDWDGFMVTKFNPQPVITGTNES